MFLIDQNISFKIVDQLSEVFPNIRHVNSLGLHNASDIKIFNFAKENNLHIITFDSDFVDFSSIAS
jgi:predicted nuclease of predicted toxin-antitoxin system